MVALVSGCEIEVPDPDTLPYLRARAVECDWDTPIATVEIVDRAFEPAELLLDHSGVVEWVNRDDHAHTVTSGVPDNRAEGALFGSGSIEPGERYCLLLEGRGMSPYFCDDHTVRMRDAVVEVSPPPG